MKIEYEIVSDPTQEGVVKETTRLLNLGWELVGGVSVSISESDDYAYTEYAQALRKTDNK